MRELLFPTPGISGFTLLELSTALFLMGLCLAFLLPAARRQRDRTAVLGAREEVAGMFHQARFEAVTRGGATVALKTAPAAAVLSAGGEVVAQVAIWEEYRVSLSLSRGGSETELSFDPLGLGRVSSQTLRFVRGDAEAGLVVSSYGRVVRK